MANIEGKKEEGYYPKETPGPRLTFWRAITGAVVKDGTGTHNGVADPGKEGVFGSNYSFAQNNLFSRMNFDDSMTLHGLEVHYVNRRVEGLPIFFNQSEALQWLGDKRFLSPPVLAKLELPISLISGPEAAIKVTRNAGDRKYDELLDDARIARILEGEELSGELFMAAANGESLNVAEIRRHETLYVPVLKEDGRIDYEQPFRVYEGES